MNRVEHTCSDCVHIDASIIDVYVKLLNMNQLASEAEAERAEAEEARVEAETERVSVFAADHSRAETDHTGAESDRERAAEDHRLTTTLHQRANSDHARANGDHERASLDSTRAGQDHTQAIAAAERAEAAAEAAEADHQRAFSDHQTAVSDHENAYDDAVVASHDHSIAEEDHEIAEADHNASATATSSASAAAALATAKAELVQEKLDIADADHSRAEADHSRSDTDHTSAASDHVLASSDHAVATTDHNAASVDHTTATADHTQAEADHDTAEDDHQVMAGYDSRLGEVEDSVQQAKDDVEDLEQSILDDEEVLATALVEQHEAIVRLTNKSSASYPNVDFLDVARIDIESESLTVSGNNISPLTTSKNKVGGGADGTPDGSVRIRIKSSKIDIEDDIIIAYQGNTSINDAKKAFTIDTAQKHRIGDWVKMDSFHLKAYYTDWLHIRDLVCNKVLEQIYRSRSNATRRPYMKYNNFSAGDIRIGSDEGALCHIDGLPAELYINNSYWGLYSLNIKKDRANYYLGKKDNEHIMVEVGTEGMLNSGSILWQYCEFRNPKGLRNMDGTDYDGDHPQEIQAGDVKTAWVRFASFLSSLTLSTPKTTIEQYINVQEFVENVVFDEMLFNLDVFRNNTLWTTWDGEHWSPLLYDMDKTFGKGESGFPGVVNGYFPNAATTDVFSLYADAKCPEIAILRGIFSQEIGARYRELRNKGIFTEGNFADILNKWTMTVGYNIYSDEVERWPLLPTLGLENVQKYTDYIKNRLVYLDLKYNY